MKKIRYGVIGIKGVGQIHIREAKANPQVELVALVDVDEMAVKQAATEHRARGFTDYVDILATGIVDAVSIAVPHHLHYPIGLACLKAGVHVYMEKPFANRVSEADALLRVAEKNNVHIAVGHQYRTQRSAKLIKQLLDSGAIGTPIRVLWMWGEFRSESYFRRDPWRNTFQNAGGGVLMSQASHDLDLLCWMLGRPVQVSAMIGNHLHEVELEDIACANVLFENGTMGSFQFTYNHPRAYSVRQIQGDKGIIVMPEVESLTHDRDEEILVGTYESSLSTMVTELPGKDDQPDISWESCGFKQSQIVQPRAGIFKRALRHFGVLKRPTRSRPIAGPVNGFSVLMDSFIDAICHGGDPLVTGKSARSVIELINAMYLSAFKKKTVDLPLDPHEYDKLVEELAKGNARVPRIRAN